MTDGWLIDRNNLRGCCRCCIAVTSCCVQARADRGGPAMHARAEAKNALKFTGISKERTSPYYYYLRYSRIIYF